MAQRIAVAQIGMRWTSAENISAMHWAMDLAHAQGAGICAFSELAVTGFHRQIAREATPEIVAPALRELQAHAARCSLAIAIGAPRFTADGARHISQLFIDGSGQHVASVDKRGLTDPEATFFARGSARPVARLNGLRCSAVICREVEDLEVVAADLPAGSVDLVFVPGALRQDPALPRSDPPEHVRNMQRLAQATRAWLVQINWPNALNRPEEGAEGGGGIVVSPQGEVLLRLPLQACGVGIFRLGEPHFDWHAEG